MFFLEARGGGATRANRGNNPSQANHGQVNSSMSASRTRDRRTLM
jgi:hypothetical protein